MATQEQSYYGGALDAFLTALYTAVDGGYRLTLRNRSSAKGGCTAEHPDAEVVALAPDQRWHSAAGERQRMRFNRQHYQPVFPSLRSVSDLKVRVRNVWGNIERTRQRVVEDLGPDRIRPGWWTAHLSTGGACSATPATRSISRTPFCFDAPVSVGRAVDVHDLPPARTHSLCRTTAESRSAGRQRRLQIGN